MKLKKSIRSRGLGMLCVLVLPAFKHDPGVCRAMTLVTSWLTHDVCKVRC